MDTLHSRRGATNCKIRRQATTAAGASKPNHPPPLPDNMACPPSLQLSLFIPHPAPPSSRQRNATNRRQARAGKHSCTSKTNPSEHTKHTKHTNYFIMTKTRTKCVTHHRRAPGHLHHQHHHHHTTVDRQHKFSYTRLNRSLPRRLHARIFFSCFLLRTFYHAAKHLKRL